MHEAAENNREKLNEYDIPTWQLFLVATAISLVISFAFQQTIMTREIFYNLYGSQMEEYRIDDIIDFARKFQVWGYLATPVIIWLRIAFVSFLIQLPFALKYIEMPFKKIFRIVTIAYFVLLGSDIVRFFYLYFQPREEITLASLNFVPLSLTNLLNKENYSNLTFSFLNRINLFEMGWMFAVYLGLVKTKKMEKIDCALITLAVWIGILVLLIGVNIFLRVI